MKTNCKNPSNRSHTWPACDTNQLCKFQCKQNMITNSKIICFKSHQPVSTSYTVQAVSNDLTCSTQLHPQLQLKTTDTVWCIWEIKTNVPKQTVSTCYPSLSPLSTNNLNTKFHRAFSAMTVPISLSLSTPVPKLPGKTKLLQASVSRSPVQTSVKPHCSFTLPNLRCSTTHVLSPDYTNFSSHTCGNPIHPWTRSLTKQNLTLQALMPQFLFLTTTSRHDARLSSTTHCPLCASRINYNLTNLSRCNSFL